MTTEHYPKTRIEFHATMYKTTHGECEVTAAIGYVAGKPATPVCPIGYRAARGAMTTLREFLVHYPEIATAPTVTFHEHAEGYYHATEAGFPLYRIE